MPKKGYRKPKDKRLQSVSIEKRHVDLIDFQIALGQRRLVIHQSLAEFTAGSVNTDNTNRAAQRRELIGQCIEAFFADYAKETIVLQAHPFVYGDPDDYRRAIDEIKHWEKTEAERIMETAPAPIKAGCLIGTAERLIHEGRLNEAAQVKAKAYALIEEWRAAGGDDD